MEVQAATLPADPAYEFRPAATVSRRGGRPDAVTSMDDMEEAFQRRKRRELEQARMAGPGEMPARCNKSFAETKWDATILVPAAAARSTRSAAERREAAGRSSPFALRL